MTFLFYIFCPRQSHAIENLERCETHPMGGSETAVQRMVRSLRNKGHRADIVTEASKLQPESCDVFVCARDPRPLEAPRLPGKFNYLWCHDDADQPMVKSLENPGFAQRIYEPLDGVILLSHYQCRQWLEHLHLPFSKVFLSGNGIPGNLFQSDPSKLRQRPRRAYFASVPWRGLEPLLAAWGSIHAVVPEAELLIFSSMQIYGVEETDRLRQWYDQARNTPGITYRGSVGQKELRQASQTCRLLAYPCVFPETSCITAMEAMASGCAVVATALGALPETAWRNPLVAFVEGWPELWAYEAARVLSDDEYYLDIARQNLVTAAFFDWDLVAQRWLMRVRSDAARRGLAFPA